MHHVEQLEYCALSSEHGASLAGCMLTPVTLYMCCMAGDVHDQQEGIVMLRKR